MLFVGFIGLIAMTAQSFGVNREPQTMWLYEASSAENAATDPSNRPSMTVFLPEASKANGTAVIVCPGGSLVSHAWESEVLPLATWLNERGIAVIGLKYRLRIKQAIGAPANVKPLRVNLVEFNQLKKANTNPFPTQEPDTTIDNAIADAQQALLLTKKHASLWGINPERIGYVGFSAGGGVVVGATVRATAATMPAFLGTLYGPSLIDVEVPKNAPGLFIGVHADHPNVAVGCMALFLEWKKAGIDAELHVYGKYTGGMYGGNQLKDRNTPNGAWQETFYSWLVANRYVEPVALQTVLTDFQQ